MKLREDGKVEIQELGKAMGVVPMDSAVSTFSETLAEMAGEAETAWADAMAEMYQSAAKANSFDLIKLTEIADELGIPENNHIHVLIAGNGAISTDYRYTPERSNIGYKLVTFEQRDGKEYIATFCSTRSEKQTKRMLAEYSRKSHYS
ncbi:MAG: hypothetical protein MJ016_01635 [Victivallaceae bacterium]|nr:hypothetical protein [Victivallaceae bacterium]